MIELSKREVFVLKKALIQLNAAEVALHFDQPNCRSYSEIERLYKKLTEYGGEDGQVSSRS